MTAPHIERGHHVFCNYWLRPAQECEACNAPGKGYWARYPYEGEGEIDGLVAKYFPNAIERK